MPFQATGDTVVTLSRSGVTKRYYSGTRIALVPPELWHYGNSGAIRDITMAQGDTTMVPVSPTKDNLVAQGFQ